MPVNRLDDNELLMRCACHSLDHTAMLTYWPDDERGNNLKGEDDDWYLSISLDYFTFWKRVKKALQYVFAPRSLDYGVHTELVLRNSDIDEIIRFMQEKRAGRASPPPVMQEATDFRRGISGICTEF